MCDNRLGYYGEEQLEAYLLNVCNVSKETLERDLGPHLTLDPHTVTSKWCKIEDAIVYAVNVPDGELDACIIETGTDIISFLEDISLDDLERIWRNDSYRNGIKSLLRYPGGLHEWLMLATLPMLKAMGIPMEHIIEYRTPTDECWFYYDGDKSFHGGTGSKKMHNDLYAAIEAAYNQWKTKKQDAYFVLRYHLRKFAEKYYFTFIGDKLDSDMPSALDLLI